MLIEPKIYYPNTVINKMNIPFTVKLAVTENDPVVAEILHSTTKLLEQDLDEIDRKFSPFKNDSLVSQYRRGDQDPLLADAMFQDVFGQCSISY